VPAKITKVCHLHSHNFVKQKSKQQNIRRRGLPWRRYERHCSAWDWAAVREREYLYGRVPTSYPMV